MTSMSDSAPLLRFVIFAAALALLLLLERLRPFVPTPPGRLAVRLSNLTLSVLGAAAPRGLLALLPVAAAGWSGAQHLGLFRVLGLPVGLAGVLGFLLLDLAVYLQHQAFHRLGWLWRLHAVHHSDLHLDATTAVRFHPGEILISLLWKSAVVALLGVPAGAAIAFAIVLNVSALLTHANLALPPALDQFVRTLLVTPTMHRWHHSTRLAESMTNFGFALSVWDRLFSSYDGRGAERTTLRIGLPGTSAAAPVGLWAMITTKL
jgi:sterol desaturase/sphingolipid hydroxylase (fatty acid hydroxylase superfamily)